MLALLVFLKAILRNILLYNIAWHKKQDDSSKWCCPDCPSASLHSGTLTALMATATVHEMQQRDVPKLVGRAIPDTIPTGELVGRSKMLPGAWHKFCLLSCVLHWYDDTYNIDKGVCWIGLDNSELSRRCRWPRYRQPGTCSWCIADALWELFQLSCMHAAEFCAVLVTQKSKWSQIWHNLRFHTSADVRIIV